MTLLKSLRRLLTVATLGLGLVHAAHAADASAPDQLIRQLSLETIEAVKADKDIQAGNIGKIIALVDSKVMPHVNFQRMTASAVGRFWRQATPDSKPSCRPSSRRCSCAPMPVPSRRSRTRPSA